MSHGSIGANDVRFSWFAWRRYCFALYAARFYSRKDDGCACMGSWVETICRSAVITSFKRWVFTGLQYRWFYICRNGTLSGVQFATGTERTWKVAPDTSSADWRWGNRWGFGKRITRFPSCCMEYVWHDWNAFAHCVATSEWFDGKWVVHTDGACLCVTW